MDCVGACSLPGESFTRGQKSTQTFFVQSFSTTLQVMDVRTENRGRLHQNVRFSAAPVVGRNFLTLGHPGVRVRNVRGKSGPKSLCLCCFFVPDFTSTNFAWVHANGGIVNRGVACVCAKWHIFVHSCAVLHFFVRVCALSPTKMGRKEAQICAEFCKNVQKVPLCLHTAFSYTPFCVSPICTYSTNEDSKPFVTKIDGESTLSDPTEIPPLSRDRCSNTPVALCLLSYRRLSLLHPQLFH